MAAKRTNYKIEILCDYPEWWRYNVYVMAVGYGVEGERVSFNELVDRVQELSYGDSPSQPPADYSKERKLVLTTDPCSAVEIYLYAVTNTFPQSTEIKESPPFPVTLQVSVDESVVESVDYEVNQWGGLTVVAHRVDVNSDTKN